MSTLVGSQSFKLRDAKGYTSAFRFYISYDNTSSTTVGNGRAVASAVLNALEGAGPGTLPITNSVIQGATGLYDSKNVALAYGTAATYLNIEDRLRVSFSDTAGVIHHFSVPAPVTAAFLADLETGKASQLVDLTNAMTTAVAGAFACGSNGLALTAFVGSLLVRSRQRRKVNIFTKSSNLDEPGE